MSARSSEIDQVVLNTGVSEDTAKKALEENGNDVISAIDALSTPRPIKGARYIPPTPTIDDGLNEEVRSKLREARAFADILNASPKNDLRGKAASHYPPVSADFGKEQTPPVPPSLQ